MLQMSILGTVSFRFILFFILEGTFYFVILQQSLISGDGVF